MGPPFTPNGVNDPEEKTNRDEKERFVLTKDLNETQKGTSEVKNPPVGRISNTSSVSNFLKTKIWGCSSVGRARALQA